MKWNKLLMAVLFVTALSAGTSYSGDVGNGKALFNDVNLGTNGKSCNSCHADGNNIDASKQTYSILGSEQESVEDAVNFCIEMALSGEALGKDSEKMNDLVSYLQTVKVKMKSGSEAPGY